ncbi:alpha/beta hydrolase [Streptomyces sp. Ac-502]|uniref:alpha/beta hydrolase n=1 Tax=Streptomyces sp. Ac-502 TaxID=3342801 RepID=UPI003862A985
MTRQLGHSGVLLTYEGHGHGSATSGPCMEDAVDSYLTDLAAPPRGTSSRPYRPDNSRHHPRGPAR